MAFSLSWLYAEYESLIKSTDYSDQNSLISLTNIIIFLKYAIIQNFILKSIIFTEN